MPEENPMDQALREIQKLLDLMEANLLTILRTSDVIGVERALDAIEEKFHDFFEDSNKLFLKLGLSEEMMRLIEEGKTPAGVNMETSEAFMRARALQEQLKELEIQAGVKEKPENAKKPKVKSLSKAEHKRKYKRFGGSGDWKPL